MIPPIATPEANATSAPVRRHTVTAFDEMGLPLEEAFS